MHVELDMNSTNSGYEKMTNYKDLLKEAFTLLDTFQPDEQCVETFTKDASKILEVSQFTPSSLNFK